MKKYNILLTILSLIFLVSACDNGSGFVKGNSIPIVDSGDENAQDPIDNSQNDSVLNPPQIQTRPFPPRSLPPRPVSNPFQGGQVNHTTQTPPPAGSATIPTFDFQTSLDNFNHKKAFQAVAALMNENTLKQIHHQYALYLFIKSKAMTIEEYEQKLDTIWRNEVGVFPSEIAQTSEGFEKFFNFIRQANNLRGPENGFADSLFEQNINGLRTAISLAKPNLNRALTSQDYDDFLGALVEVDRHLSFAQDAVNFLRNEFNTANLIYGIPLREVDRDFKNTPFFYAFSTTLISRLESKIQNIFNNGDPTPLFQKTREIQNTLGQILTTATFLRSDDASYLSFYYFKENEYEPVKNTEYPFLP